MVFVDTFSAHALFQSLITDECFVARVALFLLNNHQLAHRIPTTALWEKYIFCGVLGIYLHLGRNNAGEYLIKAPHFLLWPR